MIMVGAEMVKGGWRRNELEEVIQNGAEKRKSRDQDREDIIKSLIIIYIYIWKSRKVYVKLNIYKQKACLKRYVFRHDLYRISCTI